MTLYPIKVLGLTRETDSKIKYIGTFRNSIARKWRLEISINRWNVTNGSATIKTGPAEANLRVSATGNNTFRMLGTLRHQDNSWNIEANCLKYNLEIPSINWSYRLHPITTDVYNQTVIGEISLSRHVHDCLGGLPEGLDDFGVPPSTWCGFDLRALADKKTENNHDYQTS